MSSQNMLRDRRVALGYTQLEVAHRVGVSEATISRWESGDIANMRRDKIAKLSAVLQVSPLQVMGATDDVTMSPMIETVRKPRLGDIACGKSILAVEQADVYDDVPSNIRCDYTLRCKGDSMIDARIFDGDIVYIRSQPDVDNGQIAAVLIGDEVTLKKVYKSAGVLVLQPANPQYAPILFTGAELDTVRIIGLAVAFTSSLLPL